jgi:hypothetical protein
MGLETATPTPAQWGLTRRILFRFTCAYFVLYALPFPVRQIPTVLPLDPVRKFIFEWLMGPYGQAWDAVVLWVGKHVFDVEITFRQGGSGDTTWNYVQVFCFAVLAAAITLVWSLVDRRRPNYTRLHHWLRVYVRFYVASYMISYGTVKVIQSQFPAPEADRLLVSYGESSPMRLLWTFMGASAAYNWFTGGGEMLGGLLLCQRRTTLLGALVTAGVMAHVTALNFCYDVPVKLFSSHLVLMALFLTLPDLQWLIRAFVLGRRVEPRGVTPLTRWRWLNWILAVFRLVVVGAYVWACLNRAEQGRSLYGDLSPRFPVTGLWEVNEFESDGTARPPLPTDAERWQYLTVGRRTTLGTGMVVRTMTRATSNLRALINTEERRIANDPTPPRGMPPVSLPPPVAFGLTYEQPEPDRLVIEGTFDKHQLKVRLHRVDQSEFLLLNRGFHWINETPYNVAQPRGAAQKPPGSGR